MTTKYKIILGFGLVLAVLVLVAVIGYQGLTGSTESFRRYDELAAVNVAISDLLTESWMQAYEMEQFMATHDRTHSQAAIQNMVTAAKHAQLVLQFTEDPERQRMVKTIISSAEQYVALLGQIEKDMLTWYQEYEQKIYPARNDLLEKMAQVGETARREQNGPAINEINDSWMATAYLTSRLARFVENASEENAGPVKNSLADLRTSLDRLQGTMVSSRERTVMAECRKAFDIIDKSFNEYSRYALSAEEGMKKSYELDQVILPLSAQLNTTVDRLMRDTGRDTLAANEAAKNQAMGISAAGILAGFAFALFIIFGLRQVLDRVGKYALAVANGDFAYDPHIREKGEIGTMVTALKRIPETLIETIKECNNTANSISCGQFRDRLDAQSFHGGFEDLAKAVNAVGDSYTKVIDELPVTIVAADTSNKVQFINAMGTKVTGGTPVETFFGDLSTDGEIAVNHADGDKHFTLASMPLNDLSGKDAGRMKIITDITQIKIQQLTMEEVARQAMDISDRVAAASEQLSAQVEQVSRGAEVQRERVEVTASAMTEMNSTVLEVARNAGEASEQSNNTRSNAEDGASLVLQVVSSINDVNKVAQKLQENMSDLGEQAKSIGGVMNIISDIADQTNLLALNAAIEAARAGEAGRGFAVVADSVRSLAEATMKATQEVGTSIAAIQQSTEMNITEMSHTVRSVNEANELASSSREALEGIVNLASATSAAVASIATAAEEQSATSEEITGSIEEISRIVIETSEGMIQSSHAVQELSSMAQELKAVLDNLR